MKHLALTQPLLPVLNIEISGKKTGPNTALNFTADGEIFATPCIDNAEGAPHFLVTVIPTAAVVDAVRRHLSPSQN